jgi:hypothetical protein
MQNYENWGMKYPNPHHEARSLMLYTQYALRNTIYEIQDVYN